jgi:hypothetical protein
MSTIFFTITPIQYNGAQYGWYLDIVTDSGLLDRVALYTSRRGALSFAQSFGWEPWRESDCPREGDDFNYDLHEMFAADDYVRSTL